LNVSHTSSRRSTNQTPSQPQADSASQPDELLVKIVRSARRKRTVSARMVNWYTLEVLAPAEIPESELQRLIQQFKQQALQKRSALRHFASDAELEERATRLNARLFGGALRWRSLRFVTNQNTRFGSCSPARGTIRISHRLAGVPDFVLDYVLVHELAHIVEANHSTAFWELVYRYDKTERARGYLMALELENDDLDPRGRAENTNAGED
jgi:predicted metal-dependent hydrolase